MPKVRQRGRKAKLGSTVTTAYSLLLQTLPSAPSRATGWETPASVCLLYSHTPALLATLQTKYVGGAERFPTPSTSVSPAGCPTIKSILTRRQGQVPAVKGSVPQDCPLFFMRQSCLSPVPQRTGQLDIVGSQDPLLGFKFSELLSELRERVHLLFTSLS